MEYRFAESVMTSHTNIYGFKMKWSIIFIPFGVMGRVHIWAMDGGVSGLQGPIWAFVGFIPCSKRDTPVNKTINNPTNSHHIFPPRQAPTLCVHSSKFWPCLMACVLLHQRRVQFLLFPDVIFVYYALDVPSFSCWSRLPHFQRMTTCWVKQHKHIFSVPECCWHSAREENYYYFFIFFLIHGVLFRSWIELIPSISDPTGTQHH